MKLSLITAAVLSLALQFCAAPAYAESRPIPGTRPACGDRASIAATLGRRYNETVTARGLTARGAMIEIFTARSGTWTLVVTTPGGPSCLIAAGQGWSTVPRKIRPKPGGHGT